MDFNELIPRVGQTRVVQCPASLCNARMNGDRGIVAEVEELEIRMRMTSGQHAGEMWRFGAGHTVALSQVPPERSW